jgi:hypothetical protein
MLQWQIAENFLIEHKVISAVCSNDCLLLPFEFVKFLSANHQSHQMPLLKDSPQITIVNVGY